jgi:hypothetical protein
MNPVFGALAGKLHTLGQQFVGCHQLPPFGNHIVLAIFQTNLAASHNSEKRLKPLN